MDANTLELMFKNGMQSMGAMQMGQQGSADQAMAAEKLRQLQLENEGTSAMNPLNAQFKQAQIAQAGATTANTQAELPGIMGQSQSAQAKGAFDTQTLAPKVAAELSKYADQLGDDGMKKLKREGDIALQLSQTLGQYPPALHKEIIKKAFAAYGANPQVIQGVLAAPDGQVAQALAGVGKGMAMASAEYMQKKALSDDDLRSREKIAAGNNATSIQVANINAEAKKQVAAARGQAIKFMNSDQKITYLSGIPADERTPEEQAQLEQLSKQRVLERSVGANATAANVLNQATPTQNAVNSAGQIFGAGGTKQPAQAAAPTGNIKQVGTSGGRPVFEDEKGNRFIK